MQIRIYVCPTPDCGNFHGSSSDGDLSQKIVGQMGQNFERRPPDRWHSRAACPDCRARGLKVERQLLVLEIDPPEARPVQDELPNLATQQSESA